MKRRTGIDSWDDLRFFLAVLETQSFTEAARQLGASQPTVSRRIAALEEELGMPLFERKGVRAAPNDNARALAPLVERVGREVTVISHRAGTIHDGVEGLVRLATVPELAGLVLVPALPVLLRAHPRLRVELVVDEAVVSLSRGEADVALRMVKPQDGSLVARTCGQISYAVFGTPDVVERARAGEPLYVVVSERGAHLPGGAFAPEVPAHRVVMQANHLGSLFAACQEGLGLAVVPTELASRSGLIALDPSAPALLVRSIWIVHHKEVAKNARVRAVIDWAFDAMSPLRRGPRSAR